MRPIYFHGRNGLGDAIYTRAVMHAAVRKHQVYLGTAWPELFGDLPIRFVKPRTGLRCPRQNVERFSEDLWTVPGGAPEREIKYRLNSRALLHNEPRGLLAQMERKAGVTLTPMRFDLPPLPSAPVFGPNVAVIRPVTARTDWPNPARNPDPVYVAQAAELLRDAGFYVVSVADTAPGVEDIQEPVPFAHARFERGELGVMTLMSLIRDADVVVGGVGWVVPACMATGTPLIAIGGGRGGPDGPQYLVDSRVPGVRIRWLLPDDYCICWSKTHNCPKAISSFERRFRTALADRKRERTPC